MNNWVKQGAAALLAGLLIAASLQPSAASAAERTALEMYFPVDIEEHWAYPELDNFVVADLLKGYEASNGDIEIRPEQHVTRAEFVTLLVRSMDLKSDEEAVQFTDVPEEQWYADSVRIASSLGIVNGVTKSEFRPDQEIERGDIATMVVRAFQPSIPFEEQAVDLPFDDVPAEGYYASDAIAKASEAGIVNGMEERLFKPFEKAKRAEAVVMLQRALKLQNSELPDEKLLTSVITEADEAEFAAINNDELEDLSSVLSKYYTAFQLASLSHYVDGMKDLDHDGISISVKETGQRSMELLFASDRYAIVKSTGGAWQFKYSFDDGQQSETVSNDGHYYMKKTDDGTWKVYAIYEE